MAVTDEQHQAQLRRCVKWLRGYPYSYSYEEIPDHLESPYHPRLEPWEVYGLANPTKSAAQVDAWRRKHYPGAAAAAAVALGLESASPTSRMLD
jgi:hypothetical protein